MTSPDVRARRAWHLALLATTAVGCDDPLRGRWLREAVAWMRDRERQRRGRYVPVGERDFRPPDRIRGLTRAEMRRHIRESVRRVA